MGEKRGKIKDFDTNESKQMSSLSALIDCQLKVDWSSRSIIIWQTVLTRVWVGKSFVNKFVNKSKESWVTEGLLELSLLLPNSAVCNKYVYIVWYTHRWHSSPQPRPINQTIFWSIDCALSRLDSMSPSKRISRAAARHLESVLVSTKCVSIYAPESTAEIVMHVHILQFDAHNLLACSFVIQCGEARRELHS